LEVCVVASSSPDEGLPANEARDLPFRSGGSSHPAHTEARAEVRDRETYYAELRFAVHCQSRSIPVPRAALDDQGSGGWTSATSAQENESWDEMIARFGDTWT
jgi:hypothetical protein